MMNENEAEDLAQVTAWRRAEDRFYGSVMGDPELYMASLRLVREVVNSLNDVHDLAALVTRYGEVDVSYVVPIATELEFPRLMLLEYELVLSAAFYLRSQEILEAQAESRVAEKVAEARQSNQEWVMLYDLETQRNGYSYFQRLEMHLPDGFGLYVAAELDLEQGMIYVVEPMMLEPESGRIQKGVKSPDPRQTFRTREELMEAAARLREKYSKNNGVTEQ